MKEEKIDVKEINPQKQEDPFAKYDKEIKTMIKEKNERGLKKWKKKKEKLLNLELCRQQLSK